MKAKLYRNINRRALVWEREGDRYLIEKKEKKTLFDLYISFLLMWQSPPPTPPAALIALNFFSVCIISLFSTTRFSFSPAIKVDFDCSKQTLSVHDEGSISINSSQLVLPRLQSCLWFNFNGTHSTCARLSLAPHDDDDLSMHNEIISRRHTIIICGAKWTLELAVSTVLLSQIKTIRNGATHACRLILLRMVDTTAIQNLFLLFFIHSSFYRVVVALLCVPFLILSMLVKVKFWSH